MWIKISHRSTGKQPLIGNTQHLLVQEGPACLLQFTSSRTVVASRRSFGGRCSPALSVIVFALILQSKKLTALCCSAVYRFCWCAHYSTTLDRSIQQSYKKVPMKQFVMFQHLLYSLFQPVSAPSKRKQQLFLLSMTNECCRATIDPR
jgi:hypothetical protein